MSKTGKIEKQMNFYNQNIFRWYGLGAAVMALLVYACANRGYPEGGPKDTTPPVVVNEVPATYTRNFNKNKVEVYFSEYVQLKDVNEKFVISPPMKKNPKVSLRGKYIQVSLPDTLKPNTTYSMDFADAIVDNNEGNPLGFYRYVFSTGEVIDSLELSGNVINAESYEPMMNVVVGLYTGMADSLPLLQMPDYIARTDSAGYFRITNLREADYRVVAIADENKDKLYTPESEMFAFMDTTVRPIVMPMVKTDTFRIIEKIVGRDTVTSDSIVTNKFLAFGPSNLLLRIFQEELTQLYMTNDKREDRERINFTFSIPGQNQLKVELWDTLATEPLPEDWFFKEHSPGNDTITLWIKDSTVYKKDTLNLILTYLRTDSTGQWSSYTDTTRYTFKDKKKNEGKGKKQQKEETPAIEFLGIKSTVSGDLDLGGRLGFEFDRPLDKTGLEKSIRLSEKVDTLYQPVEFSVQEDSLKVRLIYVDAAWKPGGEYQLEIDSAAITDIYGRFNNKLEKRFKVRTEDYYGKILLTVKGVTGNTIIQLYKSDSGKSENGKRKYQVLREQSIRQDGVVEFGLLPEGKYNFRAIRDTNGNGVWDTGLFLKHRQPEEIIYLPVEMSVKQNFDIEQEFDLGNTYKEKSVK